MNRSKCDNSGKVPDQLKRFLKHLMMAWASVRLRSRAEPFRAENKSLTSTLTN